MVVLETVYLLLRRYCGVFNSVPLSYCFCDWNFVMFIAFIAITFVIGRILLFGDPVEGWPSLVCIITWIGGTQLFCLDIMGQYQQKPI